MKFNTYQQEFIKLFVIIRVIISAIVTFAIAFELDPI